MSGKVIIHGKEYKTVALRVNELRADKDTKNWSIETELVHNNPELVIMKATVSNEDGRIIGTGWAEEVRGSTNINRTSALENCETSAIGRALAAIGLGGEEYASADEVNKAELKLQIDRHVAYMATVRQYYDEITATKEAIANDDLETARAAFKDIPDDAADILWKAPSKGGIFTTEERKFLKEGSK